MIACLLAVQQRSRVAILGATVAMVFRGDEASGNERVLEVLFLLDPKNCVDHRPLSS